MMTVYKGCQTGTLYQTACAAGRRIVAGGSARGMTSCGASDCVCNTEADMRFRRATPAEAEAFFRTVNQQRDLWA